jgi:hypothetical protein
MYASFPPNVAIGETISFKEWYVKKQKKNLKK